MSDLPRWIVWQLDPEPGEPRPPIEEPDTEEDEDDDEEARAA